MGSQRVGHGWANFTQTGYSTYISSRAHLEHGRTEDKGRYPLMLVVSSKSIVITQNDLSVSRRWWSWFSCSVTSNSLWPHGLQHARIPCPSLFPGVCSNSCPLSWWCHPTISSSVIPFSFLLTLLQHQSLFQWVGSYDLVAKVSEFQLQHQSFQWIFRVDFL